MIGRQSLINLVAIANGIDLVSVFLPKTTSFDPSNVMAAAAGKSFSENHRAIPTSVYRAFFVFFFFLFSVNINTLTGKQRCWLIWKTTTTTSLKHTRSLWLPGDIFLLLVLISCSARHICPVSQRHTHVTRESLSDLVYFFPSKKVHISKCLLHHR